MPPYLPLSPWPAHLRREGHAQLLHVVPPSLEQYRCSTTVPHALPRSNCGGHAVQRAVLEEQLARILRWTADGLAKPVVVHCRRAVPDLLPVLRASGLPADRFVFHCFTETPAEARQVLDFGAMISFTGVVTFRNAPEVAEAARLVPDDRIMCETDAPWLSPEPVRSEKPCTPAMVMHTARFLAALRRTPWDDFERTVDANARRFFGLPEGTGR